MKRIFTLSAILVATSLLFPSCGTHMTIAKRQHSKGYYVDISTDKKRADKQSDEKESLAIKPEKEKVVVADVESVKSDKIGPKHVIKAVENEEILAAATATEASVQTENTAAEIQQVPAERSFLKSLKEGTKEVKSKVSSQNIKQKAQSFKAKKMESHRAGDGLSLFWIVILILLILWALGLIGGLGGFVHIALVVALILLILWLLGIV